MRRVMLLAAVAVLLSGCASVASNSSSEIDVVQVARIENAARAVGVQVYWFNYPTKGTSAAN